MVLVIFWKSRLLKQICLYWHKLPDMGVFKTHILLVVLDVRKHKHCVTIIVTLYQVAKIMIYLKSCLVLASYVDRFVPSIPHCAFRRYGTMYSSWVVDPVDHSTPPQIGTLAVFRSISPHFSISFEYIARISLLSVCGLFQFRSFKNIR